MNVSSEAIKELRHRTQAGFMTCKKALVEAGGDMGKAVEIIRKQGAAAAVKRATRTAQEGRVGIARGKNSEGHETVALFEVNSETDFVAKNDLFASMCQTIGNTLSEWLTQNSHQSLSVEDAKALKINSSNNSIKDEWRGIELGTMIQQVSGTVGEKIDLTRLVTMHASSGDTVAHYVHAGDKIGSSVSVSGGKDHDKIQTLAKDLAMHVAASSPLYLTPEDVDPVELEKEKRIYFEQAVNAGKPEEIAQRVAEGKLKSFFSQVCLSHQTFIREAKMTVSDYVGKVAEETGQELQIKGFIRLVCGESQ